MTANNANSKIRIENCQRFMKRQLFKPRITPRWAHCQMRKLRRTAGAVCFEGWELGPDRGGADALRHRTHPVPRPALKPERDPAATHLFSLPCLGNTTRDVTCCPFSIPPTISNPSGRTTSPRWSMVGWGVCSLMVSHLPVRTLKAKVSGDGSAGTPLYPMPL